MNQPNRSLPKLTIALVSSSLVLLPAALLIGWIAKHFVVQFVHGVDVDIVPALLNTMLPAGVCYLVGVVFTIYTLTVKSRYALQTLAVLGITSLVMGYVIYDAPNI